MSLPTRRYHLKRYTFMYADWVGATVTVRARDYQKACERAHYAMDARYERLGKEPPTSWTLDLVNVSIIESKS